MPFIIIGCLIMLYSLRNFKKGFILYLAFKLILVTNITILSIPGIPLLTVEDFMNIFFVLLFMYRGRGLNISKICIPFKLPFVFMIISITISMIFSIAGLPSEISACVKFIFENFLLMWVTWSCLETKEDYNTVYKLITIVMFASCIYALFEYSVQTNPLTLYELSLNKDNTKAISFIYSANGERGYRVNSFFEHAIGAGINWGIYFVFTISILINKKEKLPYHPLVILTMGLCIVCVLLTKMRAGMLFTGLASIGAFNFKKWRTYFFMIVGMLLLYFALNRFDSEGIILNIFSSLFSGDSIGGSSLEMRFEQLSNAFEVMKLSPLVGLGLKYSTVINNELVRGLLGGESIWFLVMPCFGIIGIIVWVNYYLYLIVKIPKYFKSRQAFFFGFAYFVTYTMTSVPGMKVILFYLCIFYFIKSSQKYRDFNGIDKKNELNIKKMSIRKIY